MRVLIGGKNLHPPLPKCDITTFSNNNHISDNVGQIIALQEYDISTLLN